MLRENFKAWSNGSEAYSSDPEEDEEEEEDMVFGESDQDGMSAEMMDLSDLPTALFACSIHDVVFEQDVHRPACRRMHCFCNHTLLEEGESDGQPAYREKKVPLGSIRSCVHTVKAFLLSLASPDAGLSQ
ncbi:hypothetical protein XENORESO_005820 [Xenotaenia resolanae]|uniref:Uncharacterized protein n=1 Tax=Xenotaenia resolanae TaxID=208358 RepID=A0ABV0VPT0_9TELE